MISKINIFDAISNAKAFDIFKYIASARSNSDILITHLKLTRKQYYSRMSLLVNGGLVKKEKGRYLLTAFGRVIYRAQLNFEAKLETALDNYWKLKAIDTFQVSSEERRNIISALINDQEIKDILLNEEPHKPIETANKIVSGPGNQALAVEASAQGFNLLREQAKQGLASFYTFQNLRTVVLDNGKIFNAANHGCCIASTTSPGQKTNNDHVVDWAF